ncbi:hypothetical protein FEM48_Zijuj02G0060800 [Ziziphus jujuba var. spinosa]|uniref:Uncharacterized protein n=1 Tax=Ziziphus jujuba var. spinosa TaxID=714518 RepID=A0A978VU22_ZIZJJ|nr:hypothetical protein FEM48_Zijuj02G0060800 [Ziziphus jujuba var. spinosa]
MNNLYKSIENIDDKHFHSRAFKQMLLSPCNNAESHCSKQKLKIDQQTTKYFGYFKSTYCFGQLHHYEGCLYRCGRLMDGDVSMTKGESKRLLLVLKMEAYLSKG